MIFQNNSFKYKYCRLIMSNKNNTFNIDDLLNMPSLASEFDNTSELKIEDNIDNNEIINNDVISIDELLNSKNQASDVKNKLDEIKNSFITPPPPPPIPKIISAEPNIEIEEKINDLNIEIDQPSITSAIDLNDFVLNKNENDSNNIELINEKIDKNIDSLSMNEYYKNIQEVCDVRDTKTYTRVYFDEEIESHINKNSSDIVDTNNEIINHNINQDDLLKQNNIKQTFFQKFKEKSKDFKKNLANVEQFYKFEYRYAKITWIISIFFSLIAIGLMCGISYVIFGLNYSTWLYLPVVLFSVLCFSTLIINTIRVRSMKKELKNNGYQITKDTGLTSITSIYKRLITSNYYLNWGAASIYVVSGLLILMTFIVCYFINLADRGAPMPNFGDLIIQRGTNNSPLIVVWTFASLCFTTMILQLIFNPLNIYRKNQIEVFYGKTLISEEMIEKYRKNANRKGIAIFIGSTAIISLTVLIVYFVMKKKAKKAVA